MDTVRMAHAGDAAAVAAIYAPSVAGPTSFELEPPTAGEMAARIAGALAHAPWLVLERDGAVVGYAYGARHRDRAAYLWSVDTSVYIDAAHHRTGVGRALYRALLPLLRLQGFYVAHAGVTLPNPASVGLHEALGFEPVGVYRDVGFKQGAWRDVGWWRLALRAPDGAPAPPRTPAEMAGHPEWTAILEHNGGSRRP
ncbi:arsinothricin resistance N-acetyltransferase ArsN1 family B [Sorangium sp. So ce131]|uniref:arsinothricin resistance N-acetyltransferase ArsN1 family B n=1 Tax=Sorangium sp. So ce131 TaxID=3133282 RepID=UPI003F604E30